MLTTLVHALLKITMTITITIATAITITITISIMAVRQEGLILALLTTTSEI